MAVDEYLRDSSLDRNVSDGGDFQYGGGGGGGAVYTESTVKPTLRTITFNVESTPNGASIYVNGQNTGHTTPHSLQYTEAELLNGGKIITLVNGSVNSTETYILSSQILTNTTPVSGPYSSGGGGGGNTNSTYGGKTLYQQK